MRMLRMSVVALLVTITAFPSLAAAEERHAVSRGALAAAVANHAAMQDADRDAIRQALSRPDVQQVAAAAGLDLSRATAGVATLSGTELDRAAAAARQLNEPLVGGASTVVISTTTIIIALLIVILIVIAVD